MASDLSDQAIADAFGAGRALVKFISANDAGATHSHQSGFYLPKSLWRLFTPHPPEDGVNHKHDVTIDWQDGRRTDSVVTWYGRGTRSEYRLTRFGRGFPFLTTESVGDLLVLIPHGTAHFKAYVFDAESDIEEVLAALGVATNKGWGAFSREPQDEAAEESCVHEHFRRFADGLAGFPTGTEFAKETRAAISDCLADFAERSSDDRIWQLLTAEYDLFRLVEHRLCAAQISGPFQSIEDFIAVAASLMNRRKARAGRSFENHLAGILRETDIPFDAQPDIDGRPDFIIPGADAYRDPGYPSERLFVVCLKTTCKDRWRQILQEGRRVRERHLITLQQGISAGQIGEMTAAGVSIIVPAPLHDRYSPESRARLRTLDDFLSDVSRLLGP